MAIIKKKKAAPVGAASPKTIIKLLCTKEVARIANLSTSFFEKARCRGEGPPWIKIGGSVRYREDEFFSWLETGRVTGGARHD